MSRLAEYSRTGEGLERMQGVLDFRLSICVATALVVALVAVAGTSARESGAQEGMTDLDVLFANGYLLVGFESAGGTDSEAARIR